jgi:hypothetical protein
VIDATGDRKLFRRVIEVMHDVAEASIAAPISTSAGSTPAINFVPASVKETLRVVRANKAVPSRTSTLRTA